MKKIDIKKLLVTKKDDYLFNILGIDNFNKETSHLRHFYKHLIKNEKKIKGNIFEFGCYRGKTLLATAILLKKIKSKKKVFAFDSFSGFPRYHKNDEFVNLNYNKDVYFKHNVTKLVRSFILGKPINKKNISQSLDFSKNVKKDLIKKIKYLNLDNIEIVEGDFVKSVPKFFSSYNDSIFSVNMDSDLYESYSIVLPLIYKHLNKKGYVHLDEYYSLKFPGCKIAVDEFCSLNRVKIRKNKTFEWEFDRYYLLK